MTSCRVTLLLSGSCDGNEATDPTTITISSSSPRSTNTSVKDSPSREWMTDSDSDSDDVSIQKEEEQQIEWILNQLSEEEMETAARVSYQYLQCPDAQKRRHYAKIMARRYLRQSQKKHPHHHHHQNANVHRALKRIKDTLQFRRDIDIDGLRLAFEDPNSQYQEPLKDFLSTQKNYVMGYDKEGRSTLMFVPRNTHKHDREWTLKESLYTMERAIACSKAKDDSINVVIDFSGFSYLQQAPPFSHAIEFVLTFRHHYVGQIHKIFILDAPSTFSVLWKTLRPFLGTLTRQKILFGRGMTQKQRILSAHYNPDQAADWMLPNGSKNKEWDANEYLYKTPFDQAFDE